MTSVQAVTLIFNASAGMFAFFKRAEAEKQVRRYLMEKYGLPDREYVIEQVGSYPTGNWKLDGRWLEHAQRLSKAVQDYASVDEMCCEFCADLGLFLTTFHACLSKSFLDTPAGSETHKSLLEMGRGRGNDYALKLIKNELAKIDAYYGF